MEVEIANVLKGEWLTLSLFVTSLLLLVVPYFLKRKNDPDVDYHSLPLERVEDIPTWHNFNYRVPLIIEGMATIYRFWKEGLTEMDRFAQKFGPMFKLPAFTEEIVIVQDPAIIQKFLASSDFSVLNKPKSLYGLIFTDALANGMVACSPEIWQPHRKVISKCFNYSTLPMYGGMMAKHAKRLGDVLSDHCNTNGVLEGDKVFELIDQHAIQIICEIIIGKERISSEEAKIIHAEIQQVLRSVTYKLIHHPEMIIFPPLWWLHPRRWEMERNIKRLKERTSAQIKAFKEELETKKDNSEHKSIIEEMTLANASEKEILEEVATFLFAGHDALTVSLKFFLQHIAENKEAQKMCQNEIDGIFDGKDPSWNLGVDDVSNLKYLERCCWETLRMTPSVPFFNRQLREPLTLDQFKFKKGTILGFCAWTVGRDPRIFSNPKKFDPDRFLPENVKGRNPCSILAFSYGPRNCLGWKFAILEMKVILVWILRRFNVHTEDRLEDVRIHMDATLVPERNYRISLERRSVQKYESY